MAAASLSLATGAFQLIRPRRDAIHRRVGYWSVTAMAVNGLSALTIYRFTGYFIVFHALSLYSLFNVGMAIWPMLANPGPHQWRSIHYHWIAWSYAGLSAAALTDLLLRVVHLPGWTSAAIGTPPVILLGWPLIHGYAPAPRPPLATS